MGMIEGQEISESSFMLMTWSLQLYKRRTQLRDSKTGKSTGEYWHGSEYGREIATILGQETVTKEGAESGHVDYMEWDRIRFCAASAANYATTYD